MISAILEKVSYTWSLMGASWNVLKQDKTLILFPLLSGICCLLVVISFAVPAALTGAWEPPGPEATTLDLVGYFGMIFLFYFANYFVITFFNVGIIACAISRMAGGEPTLAGGFREALARIHLIFGWALVAATVGLIIKIIEERSELLGKIIAGVLGMAWTLLTFLVVPVLVVENVGPMDALKQSAKLFRKTWGEQIVGNFSFGLLFFLISIPAFVGLFAGSVMIMNGSMTLGLVLLTVSILYLLLAGLIQSALQSIFQAAVYMYTTDPQTLADQTGTSGRGFDVRLLQDAVGVRG